MVADLIESIVKILFIFSVNIGFLSPILGWVERKQSALMQDRVGGKSCGCLRIHLIGLSSHCGCHQGVNQRGLRSEGADRLFHTIAPFISLTPAIIAFAVIPFGGQYELFGHRVNLIIADLDVGILFHIRFCVHGLFWRGVGRMGIQQKLVFSRRHCTSAQMLSLKWSWGLTLSV